MAMHSPDSEQHPHQSLDQQGKQLIHLQPSCTQMAIPSFTLSEIFYTLHEMFSTLL